MTELSPELDKLVHAGRAAARPGSDDFERIRAAITARLEAPALPSQAPAPLGLPKRLLGTPRASLTLATVAGALAVVGYLTWPTPQKPKEAEFTRPIGVSVVPPSLPQNDALRASEPLHEKTPPKEATEAASRPAADSPSEPNRKSTTARATDSLSEELALLSRAEKEFYRGNAAQALATLGEHEKRFPRGALSEERTAAKIHALCALGRNEEASVVMARLKPGSLHGQSARDACARPDQSPAGQPK